MDEPVGSENPFLRLYMKQLSLNWAVLSNTLNLLYMGERVLRVHLRDQQRLVLEEVELSTALVPRANTSEEINMADQDTKPVEEEKPEKPKPIDFDAEKASELLDVVHDTADLPNLLALNQAAMINLSIMAAEVQEELNKRAEEARKKAEEESAKKEKKRLERLKEVEEEEDRVKQEAKQPPKKESDVDEILRRRTV